MGIQRSHSDTGLVTQALAGDLAQLDGLPQGGLSQSGADFADGDVAGSADGHQVVHHVDLAERRGQSEGIRQVGMLALVVHAGHLHGTLVEGAKDKALNFTGLAQLNGGVQLVQITRSAVLVGLTVDDLGGVLVLQVQNGVALLPVTLVQIVNDIVGYVTAHHLQTVLKHAQVADDDRPAVVGVIVLYCQHSHQLRTNTSGVPQQNTEDGFFAHK